MPLTTKKINALQPEGKPKKHRDGRGLYVIVRPDGRKWWRFDYRYGGKRKTLALGTYPDVSLKAARAAHEDARRTLRDGNDPSAVKQAKKRAQRLRAGASFAEIARAWIAGRKPGLAGKTYANRAALLERTILPALGQRPIAAIEAPEILTLLRTLEGQGKHSLARRVRQVCSQIFRRAIVEGRAVRDPTADLRGALHAYIETSHAAITEPEQIGGLLRAIDGYDGSPVVRAALQLAPLLFVRPGELVRAEWSEIDLVAAIWRLPAAKMKMRADHLVPLAPQAVKLLTDLYRWTGASRYVFPAVRTMKRHLSDNTLNAALRRMGYTGDQMTAHGFRAMARTRLDETLRVPPDVIELQLAHAVPGLLGSTYNRSRHLEQRADMMRRWADYLDGLRHRPANR